MRAGTPHAVVSDVATFDRRQSQVVAPMDRRRSYVDVMERVLSTSGLSSIPGGKSRVNDFVIGRSTSTVYFTVLDHTRRDSEDF
jgi:hypothetical protein